MRNRTNSFTTIEQDMIVRYARINAMRAIDDATKQRLRHKHAIKAQWVAGPVGFCLAASFVVGVVCAISCYF